VYEKGIGVPQDLLASYIEYSKAAAAGAEGAAQQRDRLAGKLPASDLQAAQAKAPPTVAKLGGR
jgi:localization factor PodJL